MMYDQTYLGHLLCYEVWYQSSKELSLYKSDKIWKNDLWPFKQTSGWYFPLTFRNQGYWYDIQDID